MKSPEILQEQSIKEIQELRKREKHPKVTSNIDAVFVFSGPGTYYQSTENNEEDWMRWMDRDRIRMGVAIVKEVTAARIKGRGIDSNKKGHYVTKDEIKKHGPIFIYNGIPSENADFIKAMKAPQCPLPWEKVVLLNYVEENGELIPIRHTGDQVKSLPKRLFGPEGIIERKLALVSNPEHYPRIWRYLTLRKDIPRDLKIVSFTVPTRDGHEQYAKQEVDRVVAYFQKGDLAYDPIPHDRD